jgi:hypothetical protein
MNFQPRNVLASNIGRALWIGIKIAIVVQLGMESTAVIYQGF